MTGRSRSCVRISIFGVTQFRSNASSRLAWFRMATSESNANHALNRYFQTPSLKEHGYTTYCTRHSFTLYLKMARTDSNDLLYLCGWSGNSAQSKMLKHYGRQGIGDPQMVAQLAQSVRKALHFLNVSENNVASLYTV
jgi:hypothetical protein